MNRQQKYQTDLLSSLGHSTTTILRESWWHNPINGHSLRLSKMGLVWFHDIARIPAHEINITKPLTPRNLLQLERLLTEPYYISNVTRLLLFGERDAIMLRLNNGDLSSYLNSLEQG